MASNKCSFIAFRVPIVAVLWLLLRSASCCPAARLPVMACVPASFIGRVPVNSRDGAALVCIVEVEKYVLTLADQCGNLCLLNDITQHTANVLCSVAWSKQAASIAE